jgi:hypothetical protein
VKNGLQSKNIMNMIPNKGALRMNKKTCLFMLCLLPVVAFSQVQQTVIVNSYERTAPALQYYQANQITIPVQLKNGTNVANITGLTPFFSWASSTNASGVMTAVCAIVNGSNGTFNATFSQANLNANGNFIYEAGVKSNSLPIVYRQGVFQLIRSPYAAGVGPAQLSTNIDFAIYTPINAPWILTSAVDNVTIILSNGVLSAIAAAAPDLTARAQIAAHTNDFDNPHQVTAAQVGAYAANNPSGYVGTAELAGYVTTGDTRYLSALTNAAAFDAAGSAAAVSNALAAGAAAGLTAVQPASLAGYVATSRTITINGAVGGLDSNLNFSVETGTANAVTNGGATVNGQAISNGAAITITAGGGDVASVTGSGGIDNVGLTTGAVELVLSAATTASLAKAESALQDASTWSQYAASQSVNLGGNSISNFTSIIFAAGYFFSDGSFYDNNSMQSINFDFRQLLDENGATMFSWTNGLTLGNGAAPIRLNGVVQGGTTGTTNAITPDGLVDISALLGGGGGGGISGGDVTNIVNAAHWTPYVIPYATNLVIDATNGNLQAVTLTGWAQIDISAPVTNQSGAILFDLIAGTNTVVWSASISNSASIYVRPSGTTPILLIQPYMQTYWKAVPR